MATMRSYHALVAHPDQPRLLLFRDELGYTLPGWTTDETPAAEVAQIIDRLRELWSLETSVLLCYHVEIGRDDATAQITQVRKVFAVESRDAAAVPAAAEWLDYDAALQTRFARDDHRELAIIWLSEVGGRMPHLRVPWARPGWLRQTATWVAARLAEHGRRLSGPIEQISVGCISSMLRVPTPEGPVFCKATAPHISPEPAATVLLAQRSSTYLPAILAGEPTAGLLLMADFCGEPLNETPDIDQWRAALAAYAHIQLSYVHDPEPVLALPVRDWRLERLPEQIDHLLIDNPRLRAVQDTFVSLSQPDIEQLHVLRQQLHQDCVQLGTYAIPQTIDHGDLHGYNIAVTRQGCIIYDWSDLAISHPFFSLAPLLAFIERLDAPVHNQPDWRDRLLAAYLEPWLAYEPIERLAQAFELAARLGVVVQALNYLWALERSEQRVREDLELMMLWWLKQLL